MAGDGVIDGRFTIKSGGISQAIRDELGLTQDECNKLGKSIWTKIFEQVKAQDQQSNIYEGGSDAWGSPKENFKVYKDQTIEFSKEIWANIVKLVNDKLDKNIQVAQPEAPAAAEAEEETPAGTEVETEEEVEEENPEVTEPTVNTEQAKKDADAVKVTVPTAARVVDYSTKQEEGKRIAESLKEKLQSNWVNQSDVKKLLQQIKKDPELLAFVVKAYGDGLAKDIDDVFGMGFGFDKEDYYTYVLEPLIIRNENYKKAGRPYLVFPENVDKNSSLETMEYRAKELANLVENAVNTDATKARDEQEKVQKTFDDANNFLAEVANSEPKPEIKSYTYEESGNRKKAELPDGRFIQVCYDSSGEIDCISISYDTNLDTAVDGSMYDGFEIQYTNDQAFFDTDKSNNLYEGCIDKGYDFEKLKALAEKIFGKWESAEG